MQKDIDNLSLVNKAIVVATMAHAGQTRKGSSIPYITHPYLVSSLVGQYTDDVEVIVACLLHDILEDVKPDTYNESQMLEDFGESIVNLVKAVSEPKTAGEPERPWKERKDAYFEKLKTFQDKRALIVSCADKICNLNDILNDYTIIGDEIWQRFKAGKNDQLWYYEKCLEEARGNVPEGMYLFYEQLVGKLRSIIVEGCGRQYGASPYDGEATRRLEEIGVDVFETKMPAE